MEGGGESSMYCECTVCRVRIAGRPKRSRPVGRGRAGRGGRHTCVSAGLWECTRSDTVILASIVSAQPSMQRSAIWASKRSQRFRFGSAAKLETAEFGERHQRVGGRVRHAGVGGTWASDLDANADRCLLQQLVAGLRVPPGEDRGRLGARPPGSDGSRWRVPPGARRLSLRAKRTGAAVGGVPVLSWFWSISRLRIDSDSFS
jgi:hypothetical protein